MLRTVFVAECLTAVHARRLHWKHQEKLPNQRQCSNPERFVYIYDFNIPNFNLLSGLLRGEEEKGRNICGLLGLQQEDFAHSLAPSGEHHRRGCHQQSFPFSGI